MRARGVVTPCSMVAWWLVGLEAVRLPIDIATFHTYAADWRPERVGVLIDGELIHSCSRPPTYPMQMVVAVFDFPDRSTGADSHAVPELIVDHPTGTPPAAPAAGACAWRRRQAAARAISA
jgi:hypothetical protein